MGLGLNLAGADLKGSDFEAIPSDTYHCSVFDVALKETKGGATAVLPKGTPMINVQFKVEGGDYKNRRLFRQLIIAPAKIGNKPYEHKKVMDRILGTFFTCLGFPEDEVTADGFDPSPEDLIGRELLVVVGQKQKYNAEEGVMDNEVKGFRPLNGGGNSGSGLI
jgi:hypothetical protein